MCLTKHLTQSSFFHFTNFPFRSADKKMPQQNGRLSFPDSRPIVSDIDYAEARTVLDLTTGKQKELRRQRAQALYTRLLLKRTYAHVCNLLDSECSSLKPLPLSTVDTNKRKVTALNENAADPLQTSVSKKSRSSIDQSVLQFLLELNAVKVSPRY